MLADVSLCPSGAPALELSVNKGPPGKFYDEKASPALLNTLRTGGPSARIVINDDSTDEHKRTFELFYSRLKAGELVRIDVPWSFISVLTYHQFVAMAGADVLVFCSSDNGLACQRLNISPSLLEDLAGILVTRVIIENYSDYATAAVDADGWHR